jgi:hypothetical protein
LLDHIKTLSPNVLRFPGGNLSSVYFWNEAKDSPPADAPTQLVDGNGASQPSGYWYGKNSESWTMSVDSYYQMLNETNSTGIITVNYGYARYSKASDPVAAAAHLAADWVRYDNGRTKFWEIGNESNGSWQAGYRIKTSDNLDGQPEIITGDIYGKHFKVFADSMRKAANEKGVVIYIGAQLLQEAPASWWNNTDKNWNTGVFAQAADTPDYYIIHSYYTPFQVNSSAADILQTGTTVTKSMMDFVTQSILAAGRAPKPIALTEWNIFAEGSKQQASYINGMHAAVVLGELIRNNYGLACRWDLANGWSNGNDHGMFNQGDETGVPKWNPRAVYFYMYYFQKYFGDQMIGSNVFGSTDVIAYASKFSSGQTGVVIINKGTSAQTIALNISNFGYGDRYYVHSLTGGTDNGEFSLRVNVNGQAATHSSGGPDNILDIKAQSFLIGDGVTVSSPARSVQYLLIENGDKVITANDVNDTSFLKIYPNPTANNFKIELPSQGFTDLEMMDSKGRIIYNQNINPSERSVEVKNNFRPGIYLIRLIRHSQVLNRKIVIE